MATAKEMPEIEQKAKEIPAVEQWEKDIPDAGIKEKEIPDAEIKQREMPQSGTIENTVTIGGKQIEIKPMKLIYQRNRTAVFYHVLDSYPLPDILAMDNPFQDGRDGDKALFDWLVAATDDEELITEHYNEIDSGTIYKILEIFRRVNKIDEMEERAKNVEAPRAKKRG
jgi:hypothetical protein